MPLGELFRLVEGLCERVARHLQHALHHTSDSPLAERAIRRLNYPVLSADGINKFIERFSIVPRGRRPSINPVLNRG